MRRALAMPPLQALDVDALERVWTAALDATRPAPAVWVHGDFAPRNLLVRDGRLVGVIDFGQLAVGDPACDLAIAWTYLGRAGRAVFRGALGLDDATWIRAKGWVAWKAAILAAGLASGPKPDIDAAPLVLAGLVADRG